MKWKYTLLCFFPVFSFAQDSTFQLKNYKYRTPGFRAMYFNLNFSGFANESKPFSGSERSGKSISLAPSQLGYTKVISTDKRLHQSTFLLLPWLSSNKQTSGNEETNSNLFKTNLRWERSTRYYKTGLWFLEFGNLLEASADRDTRKEAVSFRENNEIDIGNRVTFGLGKGRIERVQDAQMALYILKDLKAQGLLDAQVTPALTNSFARLITDINNRRIFDSRRRRIYELTRIDSFLRTSGLINKTDIRHFTIVNDNWAFAINPYRLAGTAWFIRLKPGIGYSNLNQQQTATNFKSTTHITRFSLTPETGFEKYIPVSLEWQQNLGASIAYEGQRIRRKSEAVTAQGPTETNLKYYDSEATFTGFWGVGYFPNTRTQFGSNVLAVLTYYKNKSVSFSPELHLFANYFIGYRTYLTANGNIQYKNIIRAPSIGSSRYLTAGFGLNFSHILF